jgi:hypothetical protein
MLPFTRLKWPEMRAVALDLVARMHAGHAGGVFRVPVVDFVGVLARDASEDELRKVRARGDLMFAAETAEGGSFRLAEGERALFDLHREGLVIRIPRRVAGRYALRPGAFRVEFNAGEELEGCKRVVLLVCNRVISVDVSAERVEVRAPRRLFDLVVEF